MEEYQKEYIRKLGSRIEALDAARSALKQNDQEADASIRRIAHTLRGSGKTYGFPNISLLAELVEEAESNQVQSTVGELIKYLRSLYQEVRDVNERILVVDDSDEIRFLVSTILENQGYAVFTAETAEEAKSVLEQEEISLMILDLVLPDTDGRNFLVKLKENSETTAIPIIVLSAKSSPQIKAECYALGADAYFEKPVDPGLLSTHVAATIQTANKIKKETRVDNLTGLLNRAAFNESFQSTQKLGQRKRAKLSLGLVDLDHFKQINDDHGHLMGDAALRYIADVFRMRLRDSDVIARWGGEAFVILFVGTEALAAKEILMEIQTYLKNQPFQINDKGGVIQLFFSAGIVDVDYLLPLDQMFSAADQLMYRAKDSGRNLVFTEDEEAKSSQRKILLAEDDDLTAEFILHRLNRAGFETTHYSLGDEAFQSLKETIYDLVITDVKMPGMDGFELVQRTRDDTINRDTPIIMLTSMGRENDIARGLKLGADDYMLKPFSPIELLARVNRLFK